MNHNQDPVQPSDYQEPRCPLNVGPDRSIVSIPQRRVQEKLDEYMNEQDYAGAERHLRYWQEEARQGRDLQGQLLVCNEMIGYYRKIGERDKAILAGNEALRLLKSLSFEDTLSGGTTYVNLGTAYSAFGEDEQALALFKKARRIYEASSTIDPELLGGLYNNMGLTCAAMEKYKEAYTLYELALEKMLLVPGSEPERAITCLNLADALDTEQGDTAKNSVRIKELLRQARLLLTESGTEHNGYFAFVCAKCAPGFRYYGDEATAVKLERLAESIHEGT